MSALAPPPPTVTLTRETVEAWPQYLDEVGQRWQAVYPYRKTHRRAVEYVEGLCSAAPRKNSRQLAGVHGAANPYGFQHLLGRATWSPAVAQAALSEAPLQCGRVGGRPTAGPWNMWKGCVAPRLARTAGNWPGCMAPPIPMASSICWGGPPGPRPSPRRPSLPT